MVSNPVVVWKDRQNPGFSESGTGRVFDRKQAKDGRLLDRNDNYQIATQASNYLFCLTHTCRERSAARVTQPSCDVYWTPCWSLVLCHFYRAGFTSPDV